MTANNTADIKKAMMILYHTQILFQKKHENKKRPGNASIAAAIELIIGEDFTPMVNSNRFSLEKKNDMKDEIRNYYEEALTAYNDMYQATDKESSVNDTQQQGDSVAPKKRGPKKNNSKKSEETDESVKDAPKKRGPKKKVQNDVQEESTTEDAPKKRGPKKKVQNDVQEESTTEDAPKKRDSKKRDVVKKPVEINDSESDEEPTPKDINSDSDSDEENGPNLPSGYDIGDNTQEYSYDSD